MIRGVVVVACVAALAGCGRSAPIDADTVQRLESRYADAVRDWLAADRLARDDGWTKTVEVGQLLAWAAAAGDVALYDALHPHAIATIRDDSVPLTRGFVAWRTRPDTPFDASGTTEALRIAEGLWHGAAAFARPEDRARARLILDGYARHAGVDQGIWMIRNYYNFGTGGFATNSYLVDYDPDFVAAVARATGDEDLRALAARSLALVQSAVAPSGLLYDLVQPEVVTLMPDASIVAFSPNDIVQLSNALAVAERVAHGAPDVARGCLAFAHRRAARLRAYYLGRTGQPYREDRAGLAVSCAAVRLAARLGDDAAMSVFLRRLLPEARAWIDAPTQPRAWIASEVLSALRFAHDRLAGRVNRPGAD